MDNADDIFRSFFGGKDPFASFFDDDDDFFGGGLGGGIGAGIFANHSMNMGGGMYGGDGLMGGKSYGGKEYSRCRGPFAAMGTGGGMRMNHMGMGGGFEMFDDDDFFGDRGNRGAGMRLQMSNMGGSGLGSFSF